MRERVPTNACDLRLVSRIVRDYLGAIFVQLVHAQTALSALPKSPPYRRRAASSSVDLGLLARQRGCVGLQHDVDIDCVPGSLDPDRCSFNRRIMRDELSNQRLLHAEDGIRVQVWAF